MKVQELIYMLSREDPDAEVIILGEKNLYYPVTSIRRLNLKKTHVWQDDKKLADAYKVEAGYTDDGEHCVELSIG